MKILMLCGYFAKENEQEVIDNARAAVEFSANIFQKKLIKGFRDINADFEVISAPFIGAYPNASAIRNFKGFSECQNECTYVHFNNIWGIRNFSRAQALKKAVVSFAEDISSEKLILVYSAHTPFLEAAIFAKKKDPHIKVCLYVPDLPEYMNLSANRSKLYDIAKKYDIAVMTKLMKQVDSFVLLTEHMKERIPVGDKPYKVIEGIVTREEIADAIERKDEKPKNDGLVRVVYTGKMNKRFGVKNLVDAFCAINDPEYRLILCGRGDCEDYIKSKAAEDDRICYLGQVSADEAKSWINKAAVLVNPRPNNEEYTKYSFPSKNIEYLLSGKPVVAYMLDGMPDCYREFLYVANDINLTDAITKAAKDTEDSTVINYLSNKCDAACVAKEIEFMTGCCYDKNS